MKNVKEVKRMKIKIYLSIILINLVLLLVSYKIMPIIQSYPPNSEVIEFQKKVEKFSHIEQYALIFVIGSFLQIFALNTMLRRPVKFLNKYYKNEKIDYKEIKQVRKDCINVPYKFYITQMVITIFLGMIITFIMITGELAIFKFFLMIFSIISLIELIQFIIIQNQLKDIIRKTFEKTEKYERNIGYRLSVSTNLILQIIPLIAVSIIIISLIGYAKATEGYANASASYYEAYLKNRNLTEVNVDSLKEQLDTIPLKNESDYYFIIAPNYSKVYVSKENTELTKFFKEYLNYFFEGEKGIVYEFYGTEQQAYTIKLRDTNNKDWYIGFEYLTSNNQLMNYYMVIMIIALIIYAIFIYILAKNFSNNVANVSNSLKDILENKKYNEKNKLPIFSNDEIGDLSYYYNKIEELTEKNERELKDNQYVMQRQAQFAILGEFAGGIAHDLNSPLSAVQLDVGTLKKYIKSDKVQGDDDVKEAINDILNNIDNSLEKMGKTIAGVRNQIRATGDTESEEFSVKDVIDGIEILFGSVLRKNNCQLVNNVDEKYKITGEKNKLDRVLANIIKNSIDAYKEKELSGKIEVNMKQEETKYIISIKDNAGGIPEEIQKTLFKEMKTTKQENGTGFGLYYSNTIIESSFKGKLYFENIENGTIFKVELPIS